MLGQSQPLPIGHHRNVEEWAGSPLERSKQLELACVMVMIFRSANLRSDLAGIALPSKQVLPAFMRVGPIQNC